jgi:PIN domain nuclease of toxin-antitoxin system
MILDTCALLWLASGDSQLSQHARELIGQSRQVSVSAITAFELAQKYRKKKLSLPTPPAEWFHAIIKHHDLTVLDLSASICFLATELPPIHNDPFDRLIIATARSHQMTVISSDSIFNEYDLTVIS